MISIDSRGSSNRGKAFESHIYKRLGQVELADQLEVLHSLASDMAFLDLTRVAINGWSYGGYLSLRGLVDHPDFFKVSKHNVKFQKFALTRLILYWQKSREMNVCT